MKELTFDKILKTLILPFFLLISLTVLSQTTYTVVCDRTDNKVKIVESARHSPDFVPIKGGFPFRQIAQKWVTENYPSGTCNPDQQTKINAAQGNPSGNTGIKQSQDIQPGNNKPPQPSGTAVPFSPVPPGQVTSLRKDDLRNTSFLFNIRFSDLGGQFGLTRNMAPGFEMGLETVFGKNIYVGSGVNIDFYFTDFSGLYGYDNETFALPRIPVYVGYRKAGPKLLAMFEIGTHLNTKLISLDSEWEVPGKTASGNSFDLMVRLKLGSKRALLEFGSDYWLTGLFKDDDFRMKSTFIGGRFFF